MSSMTGLKKLLEAKAANSPMLQVDIYNSDFYNFCLFRDLSHLLLLPQPTWSTYRWCGRWGSSSKTTIGKSYQYHIMDWQVPIIWCHTNIIPNMYILLLIFIWNLNPFPNRLSCLREWLCQTQKLERLPAGRKLSIFLQNYSMLPSSSFSACQCLFPDPVRAQYRV